jgi:hypothetical protein
MPFFGGPAVVTVRVLTLFVDNLAPLPKGSGALPVTVNFNTDRPMHAREKVPEFLEAC